MEVASPIALAPAPSAGQQRCSPMMDTSNKRAAEEAAERSVKRRRFAMDVDSLSEDFSSHSIFYRNNGSVAAAAAAPSLSIAGESLNWRRIDWD